jgi:Bacterial PH domain
MQPEQGHRLAGPSAADPAPPRPADPAPPAADPAPPSTAGPAPPAADPAPPPPAAGPAPPPVDPAPPAAGPAPPAVGPAPHRPAEPGAPLSEPRTFRLPGAIVAWWAWVILAVVCLADIAFTGRSHTAVEIAATVLFVTGLVYTCALRPRVIADSGGITVQNPLRDHRIPWGSVIRVDLKESVQVHCVPEPGTKRGKVIHSWALYHQRRTRLRSELLKQGRDRRRLPHSSVAADSGMSPETQKLLNQPAAQIMANQLDDLAREARERGAAAGPRVVSWAWPAVAAIVAPGVLLVLVITVFR